MPSHDVLGSTLLGLPLSSLLIERGHPIERWPSLYWSSQGVFNPKPDTVGGPPEIGGIGVGVLVKVDDSLA